MRASTALLVVGLVAAGCAVASPATDSAVTPPPVSTPSAEPTASSTPLIPLEASPEPASGPPTAPGASGVPPEQTLVPPPDASLSVDGGDPVIGQLGSWGWRNAASDAPWLPGHPIHVGAGERLSFRMSERVPIATWQVARVRPSSVPGDVGVVGMRDGTGDIIGFDAPPRGTWSVSVTVQFAANLGGASYYWKMTVD